MSKDLQSTHVVKPSCWLLARLAHESQNGPRSFYEDVGLHLSFGVVISTDEVFMLARPVHTSWPGDELVNPRYTCERRDADAWWLYLLAGDWRQAVLHMPGHLPFIGWERHGSVHWHRTSTIVQHALRDSREGELTEDPNPTANAGQRGEERGKKFAYGTAIEDGVSIHNPRWCWG